MTATTRTGASGKASSRPDPACAAAVELALAAAVDTAGASAVGEHLGVQAEGERVVTHFFACLLPGYVGWRWAVTVARATRGKVVTVDEAVLLPDAGAVLAPVWVPWDQRLRPEDLGPGDLLPTPENDPRLEPGYTAADQSLPTDEDVASVVSELGLGRERVLSREGRDDAAFRWYLGDGGPEAPIALAAPAHCATCAFAVPLAGSLGHAFHVCVNEKAPRDGQVVSYEHGCGAHSDVRMPVTGEIHDVPAFDTLGHEEVEVVRNEPVEVGPFTDELSAEEVADVEPVRLRDDDSGADESVTIVDRGEVETVSFGDEPADEVEIAAPARLSEQQIAETGPGAGVRIVDRGQAETVSFGDDQPEVRDEAPADEPDAQQVADSGPGAGVRIVDRGQSERVSFTDAGADTPADTPTDS